MKTISFIIIGRNEGWKLQLSLKSVFDTILLNNISDVSEIIYVDSNSTDNSIEIANKFPLTNIIKISEKYINAAIARNIGASYSKGDCLIFLDGDTQIVSEFFSEILDEHKAIKYDFVTGNIIEHYYDENWKFIKKLSRNPSGDTHLKDKFEVTTGGLFFCVKRSLWDELHGMDNRFKRLEDNDFSLRLSQIGVPLLRKKEIAVIHHTICDVYPTRMKREFLSFDSKYYGHLYHKNILNKKILKVIFKAEFTLLPLLFLSFLSFIYGSVMPVMVYPFFVLFRVWYHSRNRFFSFWDILYIIKRDITVFFSFLFFFPRNKNGNPEHYVLPVNS
jgi:glycosyltransferase involved in cell wall biosynthesis